MQTVGEHFSQPAGEIYHRAATPAPVMVRLEGERRFQCRDVAGGTGIDDGFTAPPRHCSLGSVSPALSTLSIYRVRLGSVVLTLTLHLEEFSEQLIREKWRSVQERCSRFVALRLSL